MDAERESLRREYLAAIGVRPWYARCRIPLGEDLVWPELSAAAPGIPEAEPRAEQPAPQEAGKVSAASLASAAAQPSVAASLLDAAAATARPPAPTERETGEGQPAANPNHTEPASALQTGQGIEFKQRWWARDGWLIVDTRAATMRPEQQRQADRLMAALAQVLCGERKPSQAYRIDWPLFVNRSIKHDTEEARFYLQQKWQAVQQQSPVQRLLMLGDQTPDLLGISPESPDTRCWRQGDLACCLGPATSEMLHLPATKQAFWRQLKPWLAEMAQ